MNHPLAKTQSITLTGIKPTGEPHLGNYLGMIRPALKLTERYQALYFIADYHALTTIHQADLMRHNVHQVAATWLALGLDPNQTVFYRQSNIPEIFELTWILACHTPKGLLNRAHAYKAAAETNERAGHPPDDGINIGIYNYPVLMAADILLFGTEVVPVGLDQKQHLEITRDVATAFNHAYGDILTLPEPSIQDDVAVIVGLDGRKMSKSYGNTIPIFAEPSVLRKRVMQIVTDSATPDDPKDPDKCNIFNIYRHIAPAEDVAAVRQRYLNGGLAYGAIKQELFERLNGIFTEPRESYNALLADPTYLDATLSTGADRARDMATPLIQAVRQAIGMG